jgi:hypothetical protein
LPWYKVFLKMDLILKERAHLDQKWCYAVTSSNLSDIYYNDLGKKILGNVENPKQVFSKQTIYTVLESDLIDSNFAFTQISIRRPLIYTTASADKLGKYYDL